MLDVEMKILTILLLFYPVLLKYCFTFFLKLNLFLAGLCFNFELVCLFVIFNNPRVLMMFYSVGTYKPLIVDYIIRMHCGTCSLYPHVKSIDMWGSVS